jgi:hypothetical protein
VFKQNSMKSPLRLGFRSYYLFVIIMLLTVFNVQAQYSNISVTGFNNDIIANGVGATNTVSTGTMPGVTYQFGVDGQNYHLLDNTYKWYSGSAAATCGIPSSVPSAVTSGLTYTTQSASANNALTVVSGTYVGNPLPTSGTLTLSTPASYGKLFVLYESVINGAAANITATVTFTDATTQVFTNIPTGNWFTNANAAYTNLQRALATAPGTASTCGSGPFLFETSLSLSPSNYSKSVASVTFAWSTPGGTAVNSVNYLHVMALGGAPPCATPTANVTGLTLNVISASQINGSFTASSPASAGYLVVRYTSGATVTNPTNGVVYVAGQSLGLGTVVSASSATTFNNTGLSGGTAYDYYVYSYNASCAGVTQPLYYTTSVPVSTATTTACSGLAAGTYSVGPTGTYTSITAALAAINTAGGLGGSVILELQSTYTSAGETFPLAFTSYSCNNALIVRPATGATGLSITGANATGIINLNGATNVTFDGRPGGVGTTSQLTIANTNAGTSYAINFVNDASFNTVKYCSVKSRYNAATGGTIQFGVGTTTGNDNNSIDNCIVTDDGSGTFPVNGIYSSGTSAAIDNSNNFVANCQISNYFSATIVSAGMLLSGTGNSAWTISGNKFFQTANRTYTSALATLSAITIGTGSAYTITGNVIGYNSASSTAGTYTSMMGITSGALTGSFPISYTVGTAVFNATRFIGINCAFTAGGASSSIQNNTIAGIALLTSSGATTTYGILCGIQITAGSADIGTVTGNMIGSNAAGYGSLYATASTAGGTVVGIYATSANTVNIQNNTIASIDASGTTATSCAGVTGIDVAGAGSFNISSNTIGNTNADNIRNGYILNGANLGTYIGTVLTNTTGTSGGQIGIRAANTGANLVINSNTLRGFATSASGANTFTGITSTGVVTGSVSVNSNLLGTSSLGLIRYANSTTAISGAFTGISVTGATTATAHSINSNDFRGIAYAFAGTNSHTYINLTGATAGGDVASISNNTFTNLNVNTTGSVTAISHSYTIAASGTLTVNSNSVVTAFNKGGAGGTVYFTYSAASSAAGAVENINSNNFSNITVTGATTLYGIYNTDGGSVNKSFSNNIFSTWTGGSSTVQPIYTGYGGANGGNGNVISGNTISSISGTSTVTGLGVVTSGTTFTIYGNTINTLSSTGASTVTGLSVGTGTTVNLYKNKVYDISGSQ